VRDSRIEHELIAEERTCSQELHQEALHALLHILHIPEHARKSHVQVLRSRMRNSMPCLYRFSLHSRLSVMLVVRDDAWANISC